MRASLRVLLYLGLVAFVAGCASGPKPKYSTASETLSLDNAGMVVGRTLTFNSKWGKLGKPQGFVLCFKPEGASDGEYIRNHVGWSGFTDKQYFALFLEPGTYTLSCAFAYNGSVRPIDRPLTFEVERGKAKYIGTVFKSWDAPDEAYEVGEIEALAVYQRGPVHPEFAIVFVATEDIEQFMAGLLEEHPELEGQPIQTGIMQ